jgi:hypothetical protein
MAGFDLPRVKFRYDLVAFGEPRARLLELYRDKFASLMREALATRLTPTDYADLPALRRYVRKYPYLQDVSSIAFRSVARDRFKPLLDAGPAYNVCPADLKAYLLLAAGLRPHHLSELPL